MKNIIKKVVLVILVIVGVILALRVFFWFNNIQRESKPEVLDKYFESMANEEGNVVLKRGLWEEDETRPGVFTRDYKYQNTKTEIVTSTAEVLDKFKSYNQEGNLYDNDPVVFIGEWEYDKQLDTDIRLVTRQILSDGDTTDSFETKDDKNKDIPTMPLTLIRENNTPFRGRGISKAENDKVVADLRAQGYIVED